MKNLKKYEGFAGEDDNLSHGKNYMLISNLKKIKRMASYLLDRVDDEADVDEWAKDHIATSADDIEEVYNFIKGKEDEPDELVSDSEKLDDIPASIPVSSRRGRPRIN
jgi:hypothetical protein